LPSTDTTDKLLAKTGLPFPGEISSVVVNEKLFMKSYIKTLSGKSIVLEDVKTAFNIRNTRKRSSTFWRRMD